MALVLLALVYLLLAAAVAALATLLARRPGLALVPAGGATPRARRRWWTAALVLALLPLAFTGRGFLPATTLAPTPLLAGVVPWAAPELAAVLEAEATANPLLLDPLSQFIPWREAARQDLLFNPSQGGGAALLANGQSAVLFPTEVMARWLPPFRAVTFSQAARLLLAGWGMFLLAAALLRRRAGAGAAAQLPFPVLPALAAAVTWLGCGFLQVWRLHPHTLVAATAPWILLALWVLVRRPGAGAAVGLAVAGAVAVAGGHPETLLHVVLFGLLLVAMLVVERAVGRARRRAGAKVGEGAGEGAGDETGEGTGQGTGEGSGGGTGSGAVRGPAAVLAWGLAAAVLSALLAAPLLLPFVENLAVSSEWVLRRDAGTVVEVPVAEALERLRPTVALYAQGDPLRDTWSGPENLPELAGGAVGAAALLLALLAPFVARRRRGLTLGLLVVGLLGLAVSVHLPLVSRPFGEVPLLRESLLKRLSLWWSLAASLLVGLGVAGWRERAAAAPGDGPDDSAAGAAGEHRADAAVGLGAATLVVAAALAWAGGAPWTVEPRTVGWEWGGLAVTAVLLAGMAWAGGRGRGGGGRRTGPAGGGGPVRGAEGRRAGAAARLLLLAPLLPPLLLAVLLVPRVALFADWVPVVGPAGFYPETRATRHVAAALEASGPAGYRVVGLDAALVPHSAAFFGFPEVRAYDPMTFAPYAEFLSLAAAAEPRHGWHRILDPASPQLAFLGARWVFDHPSMGRRPGLEPVYLDHDALVHENPAALPRAFVPEQVEIHATAQEALAAAGWVDDFRRRVAMSGPEVAGFPGGVWPRRLPNGPARVAELVVAPGRIGAVVEAEAPALLATSQPAIPGWRLRVDGAPAVPVRVNGAFLGAVVEEGRHRVEMEYAPASWRWGWAAFAAGALLALALLVLPWLRRGERRRATG